MPLPGVVSFNVDFAFVNPILLVVTLLLLGVLAAGVGRFTLDHFSPAFLNCIGGGDFSGFDRSGEVGQDGGPLLPD